jgi:hypothetical protein
MSINQAVARGYNFFVVAVLGIVAGSLMGEVTQEGEWLFRCDELLAITVGVVAITWYLIGQHRYQRSPVPLALAVAAFAAKLVGLFVELKDVLEVGDDYNMLGVLVPLVIVAGVAYYRTRPSTLELEAPSIPSAIRIPARVQR